jgi:signal transduction histidine kinase
MTSMFRKMLMAYMSVIVIAFSVLTFALHFEIRQFLASQKLHVLNQEAEHILPILERVNGNPRLYPAFNNLVSRYKRIDNTSVNLLLIKDSGLAKIQRLTDQLVSHNDILNRPAVERVLSGQQVQLIGPFSTSQRQSTLIVGVPIESQGVIIGALFLHTPMQELQMGQVTELILLIAGPILLLSIVVLYFTSRRFSTPLLQMNRAVQAIGRGSFGQRVPVTSEDEVGQLARAFNQMAGQLERLDQMRKDLIANVSHEIRTPLTSVRGFIQGILEGVIPASDEKQYLTIAHSELSRLSSLLNTMLDLSAIETGRITIQSGPVQWASVVDAVVEHTRVRATGKGLEFEVSDPDATVTIWGDSERLTQVLFNVVDNAIRHTKAGKISVLSTVIDGKLRVEVRDTGEGISPEVLPHIWERFYTGSASRSSGEARSGLGLTITKHLVELMNGKIEVQSETGSGSVFTIWFPTFTTH